jgi:uncharacterized membrane protein
MITALALSSGALILLLAWVGHRLPVARQPLFFGLPVVDGYATSSAAQTLLRWYRIVNAAAAAAGLLLCAWRPQTAPLWSSLPVLATLVAFYAARTQVRPHRRPATGHIRSASLAAPVSGWIWAAMLPPALFLAAGALALYFGWDRLPERFPTHWNIDGTPDAWATRTPRKVFATIIIGTATWALMSAILAAMLYGTRRTPGQMPVLRASVFALVLATWLAAFLCSLTALQPLAPDPRQPLLPFWLMLGLPVIVVAATLLRLRSAMNAPIDPEEAAQFASGEFYANSADPAWMVPKASGLGYTFNFAHPIGRYLFPLIMALFTGLVIYVAR